PVANRAETWLGRQDRKCWASRRRGRQARSRRARGARPAAWEDEGCSWCSWEYREIGKSGNRKQNLEIHFWIKEQRRFGDAAELVADGFNRTKVRAVPQELRPQAHRGRDGEVL